MAGVAGRSGPKQEKPWRYALTAVLKRPCDDDPSKRRLMRVAEACVKAAENGDMQAIAEIGNRLDGRTPQALVGDANQPFQLLVAWATGQAEPVDVTPGKPALPDESA